MATGVRAASGQKIDLLTIGMDLASGFGGARLPGMFPQTFGAGTSAATGMAGPGLGGDIVAGFGGGATATGAAAPAASAAGLSTSPTGLLSNVLDSKWLNNPIVGNTLAGIGQGLSAPDPEDAIRAQGEQQRLTLEEQERLRRERIAANYRRVRPPSDARMRA